VLGITSHGDTPLREERRRLPLFSVVDRYLMGEFLRYNALALGGFVAFVLLFDALEKIDDFIDHDATWLEVLRYYENALPQRAILVAPVAALLATFLALGAMTRFREIISVKTSGISLVRLFAPLYIFGLLFSGITFLAGEWIMPPANRRAREIMDIEIKGHSNRNMGSRVNVKYLGQGNRFYVIRRYDIARETMVEPMIQEFQGEHLTRRIDAAQAVYEKGKWKLKNGLERKFDTDGNETAVPFDSLSLRFPESPADFAREETHPEEMTFPELRHYTNRVRESGATVSEYDTELHLRVAFPLANAIVILIASSLAVQMRRGGVALGFGFSLAIAFCYWCLVRAGQVLGNNGTLPPFIGAWLGNFVFITVGAIMVARTPK
jgi:lipopolysaccharide export system permease protein